MKKLAVDCYCRRSSGCLFTLITIGSRVAETPLTRDKAITKMNERGAERVQEELVMLGSLRND